MHGGLFASASGELYERHRRGANGSAAIDLMVTATNNTRMESTDSTNGTPVVRLAHFSDIHITSCPLGAPLRQWLNRRTAAWLNLRVLGRARRFRHADDVIHTLMAELRERGIDHLIFSGDATALGCENEMARAAKLLQVAERESLPGLAVPGNHDYCTPQDIADRRFERHFAPWLAGERVDGSTYPFAQRVGHVWLVAVNSSTANRWPWDASGAVSAEELKRLEELLPRLTGGPRILITHYPLCKSDGDPEPVTHGLRNRLELLDVAARGGVALWLHGHRHHAYQHHDPNLAPFPVICAGSATQSGRWSYGDYTIRGNRLEAVRRSFDLETGRFRDAEKFELELQAAK